MNVPIWKVKSFADLSVPELYAIMKIRQEVFIVEQNCPYLDADDEDEKALHLWAENEGKIVAYCRIFDCGIRYSDASIGRVLTHPQFRSQKLGRILMRFAINTLEQRFGAKTVRISAQDYLLKFYGDFGFHDTGKKYLEDGIPHTEMIRRTHF